MKVPSHIRLARKTTYSVLFSHDKNDVNHGSCDYDIKQIVININQSKTNIAKTALHEILHAVSYEHEINLTETQVRKLEDALWSMMNLNKVKISIRK